jgi:quercetin dioxygenase-like cupin family protein
MRHHGIHWDDLPWIPVRDGVARKAITGEGATVALHRLMPGCEPRPHQHPYEQIAYIMSGEVDFYVDGDPVRLRAGGMVVVPPNVMHHAVVIGDEPVMNLDIFTPKRAEYVTSR